MSLRFLQASQCANPLPCASPSHNALQDTIAGQSYGAGNYK